MMGGVTPETCWASYKYGIIKFWYIVASCWIFLYHLYYAARIHEHKVKERVQLYLYSTSGPSWPVTRRPLPLYSYPDGWLQKQKRKIHTHAAVNYSCLFSQ
jgi:hypothetical protein